MHKPRKTGVGHNKQFGKFVFTIFERRHLIMFFSYFQISGSVEWASNFSIFTFWLTNCSNFWDVWCILTMTFLPPYRSNLKTRSSRLLAHQQPVWADVEWNLGETRCQEVSWFDMPLFTFRRFFLFLIFALIFEFELNG